MNTGNTILDALNELNNNIRTLNDKQDEISSKLELIRINTEVK